MYVSFDTSSQFTHDPIDNVGAKSILIVDWAQLLSVRSCSNDCVQ